MEANMERVSVVEGDRDVPAIIIAPHGAEGDDDYTAPLAETIANEVGCYAVINWGWERADKVDYFNDKANCNNIVHLQEDVVKDEFLDPIERYVNRIYQDSPEVFIYIMHGMGDDARKKANDPGLDLVIGYGEGQKKSSLSCDPWREQSFAYICHKSGFGVHHGKGGGSFAGNARNNLNQLYRKWQPTPSVHSMQIEVIRDMRLDEDTARFTGEQLAMCVEDHIDFMITVQPDGKYVLPKDWAVDWEDISRGLPRY
jgi:hypothetical protein